MSRHDEKGDGHQGERDPGRRPGSQGSQGSQDSGRDPGDASSGGQRSKAGSNYGDWSPDADQERGDQRDGAASGSITKGTGAKPIK
jgi:hypothetical protein